MKRAMSRITMVMGFFLSLHKAVIPQVGKIAKLVKHLLHSGNSINSKL
jgi:hypothetical protein